jgi:hypothetical protein
MQGVRTERRKQHTSRPPRTLPTIVPANFPPVKVDDPFGLFPAAAEADALADAELEEEELGRGAKANPQTDISVLAIISSFSSAERKIRGRTNMSNNTHPVHSPNNEHIIERCYFHNHSCFPHYPLH